MSAWIIIAGLSSFLPIAVKAGLWALVVCYFLWKVGPLARPFVTFLFLMASLSVFRLEAFWFRPYWDSILGCFAEAIFLHKSHFNYLLLLTEAPYISGGPKVYVTSVFPTYLALLMKAFPGADIYLPVMHLFAFTSAAISLTIFYTLMQSHFDRRYAALGVLLLMMDPLFLSQTEAINMEIWLLMASLLGLSALLKRRIILAAVYSTFGLLVKGSGVLAALALAATYVLTSKDERPVYYKRIVVLSAPALLFVMYSWILPAIGIRGELSMGMFSGIVPMIEILRRYLPLTYGLSVVLAAFALYSLSQMILILIKDNRPFGFMELFGRVRGTVQTINPLFIYSLLYLMIFYLSHTQFVNILPRYFLLQAPFLIIGLLYVVRNEFRNRLFRLAILLICTGWSLANIKGALLEVDLSNNGHYLEQTLAFEDDLRFERRLSKYLAENYGDKWIMTSWPLTQILSLPELGYLEKPLKVISAGRPCRYCGSSVYLYEVEPTFRWESTVACFPDNIFSGKNLSSHVLDPIDEYRDGERKAPIYRLSTKIPR